MAPRVTPTTKLIPTKAPTKIIADLKDLQYNFQGAPELNLVPTVIAVKPIKAAVRNL